MKKKEKIQLAAIGVVVVVTLTVLWFRDEGKQEEERLWVARPESGTSSYPLSLSVGEQTEKWDLAIESREKTPEETEAVFSETIRILEEQLGIGEDGKGVWAESVSLPKSLSETGVDIRWSSSQEDVLSKEGIIYRERLSEPREVVLQAYLRFGEEEREHWFTLEILPYEADSAEALLHNAKEILTGLEKETSGEDGFYLPEKIGPVRIEKPDSSRSIIGLLVVAVMFLPVALVITKRQEKEKEKKKREEELLAAYPRLVTKLTLFTGAGLSLRGAWERLASECRTDEEGKRNAVDEEILMLVGELKNGTSEAKAYEAMGRRIGLKPYLRCASLLVSQLQKGSGSLRKGLETEAGLAWEMHRERAAKKGEEAQTKMLFPMMGMLFLVMAVVMIPAFFAM